jgi:hypothetical protein
MRFAWFAFEARISPAPAKREVNGEYSDHNWVL